MLLCILFIACGVLDVHSTLGTEFDVTACRCTDRRDVRYSICLKSVATCSVIAPGSSEQPHCSATSSHTTQHGDSSKARTLSQVNIYGTGESATHL